MNVTINNELPKNLGPKWITTRSSVTNPDNNMIINMQISTYIHDFTRKNIYIIQKQLK